MIGHSIHLTSTDETLGLSSTHGAQALLWECYLPFLSYVSRSFQSLCSEIVSVSLKCSASWHNL